MKEKSGERRESVKMIKEKRWNKKGQKKEMQGLIFFGEKNWREKRILKGIFLK